MNASDHGQLVADRQELVHHAIVESVQKLGGHLPPPDVDFGRCATGRFSPTHPVPRDRRQRLVDLSDPRTA